MNSSQSHSRIDRVEQTLKEVLASKMISYSSLFDGALVTVVRVHCSPDLKSAKVFLSIFGSDDESEIFEQLEDRRAQLQHEVSKKVRMKFCPKISFIKDGSIDKLVHVSSVLNKDSKN
jgi:ribosome-binding factor A